MTQGFLTKQSSLIGIAIEDREDLGKAVSNDNRLESGWPPSVSHASSKEMAETLMGGREGVQGSATETGRRRNVAMLAPLWAGQRCRHTPASRRIHL